MAGRYAGTDWHELRHEVEAALRACGALVAGARVEGKLSHLGEGIHHRSYVVRVQAPKGRAEDRQAYVVRMRDRDADDEGDGDDALRMRNEARLLGALAGRQLGFAVPRFVSFVGGDPDDPDGLIETAFPGIPLDWFAKSPQRRAHVIETISRVAASIHAEPTGGLEFLPHHADSRSHVFGRLRRLPEAFLREDADAAETVAWVIDHVSPPRPAVLLHGDLLPQNILGDVDTDELGVIDWEFAELGDPAYDISIVTRGGAKLFGAAGGADLLLDAYHQAGGAAIARADVLCHELILVLRWLWGSVQSYRRGRREGHPPEQYRNQIRTILRRATK